MSKPLVLAVGNRFRRDDGVGPVIGDRLRDAGFEVLELSGEGAGLIEAFSGRDTVILIDASRSGAEPGTVHAFDATETELPRTFFHASTHLFGVAEAVETARALGRLPKCLLVYGIEGAEFGFGEGLSEAADAAISQVVGAITETT